MFDTLLYYVFSIRFKYILDLIYLLLSQTLPALSAHKAIAHHDVGDDTDGAEGNFPNFG